MNRRHTQERDFPLKVALRKLLWLRGYSTRIDTLLAFPLDTASGRQQRAGVTDLDVLGVRLDPAFRLATVVSECKTGRESAAENLFWLKGVGSFFDADELILVRSEAVPGHAKLLSQNLGISLLTLQDVIDLTSTYPADPDSKEWDRFFSPEVIGKSLEEMSVSRLPAGLREVGLFRETHYWMQSARNALLTRTVASLRPIGLQNYPERIGVLIFADYVWLMVLAIWEALQYITSYGIANIEESLRTYLVGGHEGLRNAQRMQSFVREIGMNTSIGEVSVPIYPPYFDKLLEIVVRCARRPEATSMLAQRAEWLLYGQIVAGLGGMPGTGGLNAMYCDKLLGDIAIFLADSSGVGDLLLAEYLSFLDEKQNSI